jgi:hypothetical protein
VLRPGDEAHECMRGVVVLRIPIVESGFGKALTVRWRQTRKALEASWGVVGTDGC